MHAGQEDGNDDKSQSEHDADVPGGVEIEEVPNASDGLIDKFLKAKDDSYIADAE